MEYRFVVIPGVEQLVGRYLEGLQPGEMQLEVLQSLKVVLALAIALRLLEPKVMEEVLTEELQIEKVVLEERGRPGIAQQRLELKEEEAVPIEELHQLEQAQKLPQAAVLAVAHLIIEVKRVVEER